MQVQQKTNWFLPCHLFSYSSYSIKDLQNHFNFYFISFLQSRSSSPNYTERQLNSSGCIRVRTRQPFQVVKSSKAKLYAKHSSSNILKNQPFPLNVSFEAWFPIHAGTRCGVTLGKTRFLMHAVHWRPIHRTQVSVRRWTLAIEIPTP